MIITTKIIIDFAFAILLCVIFITIFRYFPIFISWIVLKVNEWEYNDRKKGKK